MFLGGGIRAYAKAGLSRAVLGKPSEQSRAIGPPEALITVPLSCADYSPSIFVCPGLPMGEKAL